MKKNKAGKEPNAKRQKREPRHRLQLLLEELESKPPQTKVEVRTGLSLRRTAGGILVPRLHYSAMAERNPDINPQWKAEERRTYTSQASWDREQEIIDEAGGGELVFADALVNHWNKIVITDPNWRPDPDWIVEGGMDHGKTNPTCVLRCYHDFDGTMIFAGEYYRPGKEIWQHAPEIQRMPDFDRMESIYADPTIYQTTLQQSQRPGEFIQRAKSVGELYYEQGIENFIPFGGDRSDVSFAHRLQQHWMDLEHLAPTVRIVCRNYSETPQYGLHKWDCPNLLWELMRCRRQKLTAQQLLTRNTSEAIVDKDNHAIDAMKYQLMSHPEPSRKPLDRRVAERLAEMQKIDPTAASARYFRTLGEEGEEEEPKVSFYTRNARRLIWEWERRRGWRR